MYDTCKKCGCIGSDWCMVCTVVPYEDWLKLFNITFHKPFDNVLTYRPSGGDPALVVGVEA